MECSELLLLNSLFNRLPINVFKLATDHNEENTQELESIKLKITCCIDKVASQSPINDIKKLKQKWEKYCSKLNAADSNMLAKSVKLANLAYETCKKVIYTSQNEQSLTDNEIDIERYRLQQQFMLYQLANGSEPCPTISKMPNTVSSMILEMEQTVEDQQEAMVE